MPTRRCLLAEAAGAAMRTTANAAITALHTNGLPAEGREHPSEPLLQLDLRLPAEHLPRTRAVGLSHLRVVDRKRHVANLARRAGAAKPRGGELVQRELPG